MQVKAGVAVQMLLSLQKLGNTSYPAREAFLIAKVQSILRSNPDVVATDAARMSAMKLHGSEKDGQLTVFGDGIAKFLADYEPISSQDLELDLPKLPLSILDRAPEMTPNDMNWLGPLFEEG